MVVKNRGFISAARKKLEKDREHAEVERLRRLRLQRLEFARAGIAAYQRRRIVESVRAFSSYIQVLEELNKVGPGGLLPSHFDIKKDSSELLMLSGVYWDLVKLYDRTRSKEKRAEFTHYLEKYVIFSKGMPYQHLCAEALRKYIVSEKPVHREDFKSAYRVLSTYRCFVATSLVDVTDELTLLRLRLFRDQVLSKYTVGKAFIKAYYRVGPWLGEKITVLPEWVRLFLGKVLDLIAKSVSYLMRSSE